jgi:hypothetical protein
MCASKAFFPSRWFLEVWNEPNLHHFWTGKQEDYFELYRELKLKEEVYGYKASFNPTYPDKSRNEYGWVSPYHFGINQAPIVLMIENYRTGFVWNLMKRCSSILNGLRKAGFRGGWVSA